MVAVQREMHGGETSQSDWSEEEEERGETDDGGLDQLSMAANGGLTDAEGVNKIMESYKLTEIEYLTVEVQT